LERGLGLGLAPALGVVKRDRLFLLVVRGHGGEIGFETFQLDVRKKRCIG
jgi:hypothetical protein